MLITWSQMKGCHGLFSSVERRRRNVNHLSQHASTPGFASTKKPRRSLRKTKQNESFSFVASAIRSHTDTSIFLLIIKINWTRAIFHFLCWNVNPFTVRSRWLWWSRMLKRYVLTHPQRKYYQISKLTHNQYCK